MRVGQRIAAGTAALAVAAGVLVAGSGAASAAPPATTPGPCGYTVTPDEPAARPVPLPPDPARLPDRGTVLVTLWTNHGPIPMVLDRALAPCTVQSTVHLVRHHFYDDTFCHRLTAYPTLKVLQCGDPSGTGSGGPGYSYRDELPTHLPPAPTDPTGVRKLYARALVAMANAGPDTNGSQFFLVYGDSALRPNYTVFGEVTDAGMRVLDHIAAGGVEPAPGGPTPPVDGPPAYDADIWRATARPLPPR